MAAELQTITAVINLTQLAWRICIFFKNVHDSDATAKRLYEKIEQLHQTLQNVKAGLHRRQKERKSGPLATDEARIESNIRASLNASHQTLHKIDRKLKDFDEKQKLSLSSRTVARVQFIWKQQAITRHEDDIDIQIQALQTSLGALQL